MADEILEVTDSTFDANVLDIEEPALVYFFSSWSRQCRERLWIIEDMVEGYEGKIRFFKFDVVRNSKVPSRIKVRVVPTIVVFKRSEEINRFAGTTDPVELRDYLDTLLEKPEKKKEPPVKIEKAKEVKKRRRKKKTLKKEKEEPKKQQEKTQKAQKRKIKQSTKGSK